MSNIETCVSDLGNIAKEYNAMSDDEKMNQVAMYNDMMQKKKEYLNKINEYKDMVKTIDNSESVESVQSEENKEAIIMSLMKQFDDINMCVKENGDSMELGDLIVLYKIMVDIENKLTPYFDSGNDKMNIINL